MWLESYLDNEEVKQSILSLDVLKYLVGAVSLLKRQPPRNSLKPKDDKGLYTSDPQYSQINGLLGPVRKSIITTVNYNETSS